MSDCYIGRKPCGCAVAAIVIEPMSQQDAAQWRKEVARFAADCIRRGMSIERVSVEYVRQHLDSCEHEKRKVRAVQEALAV